MDAWETLLDNSTLAPTGFDAWEHLNAQGGGVPSGTYILADGLDLEVDTMEFDIELDLTEYTIEVETHEFDVELETTEFEIEVC